MRDTPVNPYQSPVEAVSSFDPDKRSFFSWRTAIASICFLFGAAFLAIVLCLIVIVLDSASSGVGTSKYRFAFALSGFWGATGAAFLKAGFSTINGQDEKALRSVATGIIIFAIGLAIAGVQ